MGGEIGSDDIRHILRSKAFSARIYTIEMRRGRYHQVFSFPLMAYLFSFI